MSWGLSNAPSSSSSGGGGGNTYVHNQGTASDTWTVDHNLGGYPSVTITDSSGEEVEADLDYTSNNQVIVTFASPFAGVAYCDL